MVNFLRGTQNVYKTEANCVEKVLQNLQDPKKRSGDPETSTEETGFEFLMVSHQYINHKHTVAPMNYILQIIMF